MRPKAVLQFIFTVRQYVTLPWIEYMLFVIPTLPPSNGTPDHEESVHRASHETRHWLVTFVQPRCDSRQIFRFVGRGIVGHMIPNILQSVGQTRGICKWTHQAD